MRLHQFGTLVAVCFRGVELKESLRRRLLIAVANIAIASLVSRRALLGTTTTVALFHEVGVGSFPGRVALVPVLFFL